MFSLPRKVLMFCNVGTSGIGNIFQDDMPDEEKEEKAKNLSDKIKNELEHNNNSPSEKLKKYALEQFSNKKHKNLYLLINNFLYGNDALNNGNLLHEYYPSAECQSIMGWLLENTRHQNTDVNLSVYLFPSKKSGSEFTAWLTYLFLKSKGISMIFPELKDLKIEVQPLDINVDTDENFFLSIDTLYSKYEEIRQSSEAENAEIVINSTGGYKSISGYASLYALLNDIPSIYVFEEGGAKIVELASLPLSCAIGAMDEEISLLRGLKNMVPAQRSRLKEKGNLPRWIEGLFFGESKLHLVDNLTEQYETGRYKLTGVGMGLLNRLKRKDAHLGRYFEENITGMWSELWMGDQIPETVEHTRRHSKRLMEIAENLFRSADETLHKMQLDEAFPLALLIAAIYLHDIGHTAMIFPVNPEEKEQGHFPLSMFPSSVREIHHLLSHELIKFKCEELFPPTLTEDAESNSILEDVKKAVPLVCAYHRGYTKLRTDLSLKHLEEKKKAVYEVASFLNEAKLEKSLLSLEKNIPDSVSLKRKEQILKVAALLRVVDGSDVQADRIVSNTYLKARLERTKTEAEALWTQLEPLMGNVPEIEGHITAIRKAGENFTPDDAIRGTLDGESRKTIKNSTKTLYPLIFQKLKELKGNHTFEKLFQDNEILQQVTALSLVNRIAFKWEQFLHFYKHRSVDFVLPLPDDNNGVSIHLFADNSGSLNEITEEINDEYRAVEDILGALPVSVSVTEQRIR